MRALQEAAALGAVALLAAACAWLEPAPAWERPPPPVREGPVVPGERLYRTTLPNGLQVLVLEDRRLPRLRLGLVVPRGAGVEERERAGLASLTADLMERGAGERDALALARAVDDLGADLAVSAGWDSTRVLLSGLSEDRDALLGLLVDVVRRPRFEAPEAERARSERLAALERAKDDPGTLAGWAFLRALYPDHRYGLPLEGTSETVAGLDAPAVRAFHAQAFGARDAILFAVGDVGRAEIEAFARAALGDWPSGDLSRLTPEPPAPAPPERRVVIVDRPDLNQAQIVIGHEGMARSDPERVAAGLMNDVLGGSGFLSRLMVRVRSGEGLTYAVGSGFSLRRQPGPFTVGTFTRVPETRKVVDLVLAELVRMQQEPPSPAELETAKSYAAGSFALELETAAAIAGSLVDLEVYGLPPDALDTYRSRVRAVGPDDVARAARTRLHPQRAAIVVVGPAQALRPQLADLGPVQVVQP